VNLAALSVVVVSIAGAVASADRPIATPRDARGTTPAAPCGADSGYRRLAFWVGDWTVFDSTGKRYAAQRVRDAVDQCALTVEWTGSVGDKGLSVFGFDARSNSWKQMYVSNQLPRPSGVILRQSDPDYAGPGVRFIPVIAPPPGATRTRVTIMPVPGGGVMQLFEDSRDDGKTWRTVFKGEHRPAP
jgi:hypothetical protein